jgi:PPM family protein phosphatase
MRPLTSAGAATGSVAQNVITAWAAASDKGKVRQVNEDSGYAGRWLRAIADGMGGHVAGEVASATVIDALAGYDAPVAPTGLIPVLGRAVREANAAIRARTQTDTGLRSMGTTLTATLWSGHVFALAHIGDSRAYMLRDGRLRRLTEDHTLRNLVANAGAAQMADAMSRYLDGRPDRSPDLSLREAVPGDRYLLCSDGLSGVLPPGDIQSALQSADEPANVIERLIHAANKTGGPDNITAIIIDAISHPQPVSTPPTAALGAAAPQNTAGRGRLHGTAGVHSVPYGQDRATH